MPNRPNRCAGFVRLSWTLQAGKRTGQSFECRGQLVAIERQRASFVQRFQGPAVVAREAVLHLDPHGAFDVFLIDLRKAIGPADHHTELFLPVPLTQGGDHTAGAPHGGELLVGHDHNLLDALECVEDRGIRS